MLRPLCCIAYEVLRPVDIQLVNKLIYCGYESRSIQKLSELRNAFVTPLKKMQELVREKMKEIHFPVFLSWFFTKGIPNLKRWNKSDKA